MDQLIISQLVDIKLLLKTGSLNSGVFNNPFQKRKRTGGVSYID